MLFGLFQLLVHLPLFQTLTKFGIIALLQTFLQQVNLLLELSTEIEFPFLNLFRGLIISLANLLHEIPGIIAKKESLSVIRER